MSDKPPEDKDSLLELLKKLWLPVAGFLGAVTLAYNFYKLWLGDQDTVTIITASVALMVLVIALGWVGFGYKKVVLDAVWPIGAKKIEKQPPFPSLHQRIARISLGVIFLVVASGAWLIIKNEQRLADKVVLVIAKFDGPEEKYGIRDEIIEQLREATKDFDDTVIIPLDEVVTPALGSEYARNLGERHKADLIIWAWYKPTDNPNITLHIENLSSTEITEIKESEIYQPQATLADLETFEVQRKISSETSTLISFLTGMSGYQSGAYQTAIKRFEQVLAENDISTFISRYDLFLNLGNSNNRFGNYENSIQNYGQAMVINPLGADAYVGRGVAYYYLDQYELAFQDYEKAIEIDPQHSEAYFNRGVVYYGLREYKTAIQELGKAIEINSKYELAYSNRGAAYNELGEHEQAIQDFTKAIEINPQFAGAYSNRGIAYYNLGKYNLAIHDQSKAIKLQPRYAKAYYNRGNAYHNLGEYERAIRDYDKAIEFDPQHAKAHSNRGSIYYKLGEYERAIQDYDKAIKINSKYVLAYSNRGAIYTELGEYEQAIQDFTKAIEIDPQFANAYYNRGISYQKLGRTAEAEADFKKYEELTGKKP